MTMPHADQDTPPPTPSALHEYMALACAMLDTDAYAQMQPLTPADFGVPLHPRIWATMETLHAAGSPLTPVAVLTALQPQCVAEDWEVYHAYVPALLSMTLTAVGAEYHAGQVRAYARNRRAIERARSIAAYGEEDLRATTEAERMSGDLAGVGEKAVVKTQSDLMSTALTVIEERLAGKRPALKTGIAGLAQLNIFGPQCFVLFAARPGVGKSQLGYQMAHHAAAHGSHGLFASLEMSGQQLSERILSAQAQLSPRFLTFPQLMEPEHWDRLLRAAAEIAPRTLDVLDVENLTFDAIALQARRMKAQAGLDFVVIDYVQLLPAPAPERVKEADALTAVSRKLKALARELNVCLIGLSQINREGDGKRPGVTNLAGSDALGRDADTVLTLWPNGDHGDNGMDTATGMQWLVLDVQKNRNGPRAMMDLLFNPETMTMSEVAYAR